MSIQTARKQNITLLAQELAAELETVIDRHLRSCLTCMYFKEDAEVCEHKQNSGLRPPARVIAFGCKLYSEEIPF